MRKKVYVIGASVHLYDSKKCLNGTVEVALPFQTLAVDILVEFILTTSITARSDRNAFLVSKSRISLFNVHLALFV